MTKQLGQLIGVLNRRQQSRLYALLAGVAIAALVEMTSVLSVLPFLSMASDPGRIHQVGMLNRLYRHFEFSSDRQFLVAVAIALICVLLATSAWNACLFWLQQRFVWRLNYEVSECLMKAYLQAPFTFFFDRNTTDLQRYVQSEVNQLTSSGFLPLLTILQKLVAALCILSVVIYQDPVSSVAVVAVLVGCYLAIYVILRRLIRRMAMETAIANHERFRAVSEAFGDPRLTRLWALEQFLFDRFSRPVRVFCRCSAWQKLLTQMPKFCLEALSISAILGVAIYYIATRPNFTECVPMLGLFAFAAYRLLPAVQAIYAGVTTLQTSWPRIQTVLDELAIASRHDRASVGRPSPLVLQAGSRAIEVAGLAYSYPASADAVLKGIDLVVEQNSTVGICGSTGAGKTTLVDLMLGLLVPDSGTIRVWGNELTHDHIRSWHQRVGYVPQDIYLCDGTIADNIAFGSTKVDRSALRRAAELASIDEFITSLPNQYDTRIGERGIRLSGGQRQRIGIARALYRDPDVLFFDEATSSLDNETERAVMEAIARISHTKTVVLVAHRLSTLRLCEVVYRLEEGTIVDSGSFDEVIGSDCRLTA